MKDLMNWTPIAVTDECTTCGFCGKDNLKKTVVFESADGDIQYLGTDCASKLRARQAGKDPKAYAAARIARTIQAMRYELRIAEEHLQQAVDAQKAGKVHGQFFSHGITWEKAIELRTNIVNQVKAKYGVAI
jgi:hypothetical protein